ncbi:MAG: hypothetical protein ABI878_02695 [Acidobacteriota bacterium]
MQKIVILSITLFSIALAISCSSQGGASTSTSDTPTAAYKRLYAAVKSKNTEAIKGEMSKQSITFVQSVSAVQKKTIEEVYSNGLTGTTFSETMPELRDERVKDNMGAIEVYNSKESKWEDLPFVLEDGKWKLALGDAFKGTFVSPGKGRDQKEKEAANATSNTGIHLGPPANANTQGMTINTQPNSTASNSKANGK